MLDELRKKSPLVKQTYAFWGAFLITAMVALVWGVGLMISFSDKQTLAELEKGKERAGAFAQFFGQIKDNVANSWQENKEALSILSSEEAGEDQPVEEENNVSTTTTPITPVRATSSASVILIATSSAKSINKATSSSSSSN